MAPKPLELASTDSLTCQFGLKYANTILVASSLSSALRVEAT